MAVEDVLVDVPAVVLEDALDTVEDIVLEVVWVVAMDIHTNYDNISFFIY